MAGPPSGCADGSVAAEGDAASAVVEVPCWVARPVSDRPATLAHPPGRAATRRHGAPGARRASERAGGTQRPQPAGWRRRMTLPSPGFGERRRFGLGREGRNAASGCPSAHPERNIHSSPSAEASNSLKDQPSGTGKEGQTFPGLPQGYPQVTHQGGEQNGVTTTLGRIWQYGTTDRRPTLGGTEGKRPRQGGRGLSRRTMPGQG